MSKELRHYQVSAKEAVFTALKRGRKKQLIVLPGGTGKTVICINIMKEFTGRKLWICHEESLAEQSVLSLLVEMEILPAEEIYSTIKQHESLVKLIRKGESKSLTGSAKLIYDTVGVVKADLFDISKPITVASAQTLWRRLDLIPKDQFECIIVDEGDLFGSKSFKAPLDYLTPQLLVGATATPMRTDNMLMEDIFEEIVYEYPIQNAIKEGYLTELNAIVVKTTTNLDSVHTAMGDFNQKELTEKINTPQRNLLIVNKYIEYCTGQQFICFGADVQHVIDLHEAFREKGINTAYVVSDKERMEEGSERFQIVQDYRDGQIMGLVNFNIFGAGFDHRDCGCVILGCPTKSKRKFLQQLFRVTRLKTEIFVQRFGQIGTILDIVDGTSKHVLINTKELDKGLPVEERLFVSQKNKELLLQARRDREITLTVRKEDKKVQLFPIPKVRISTSFRMSEPATQRQLDVIKSWNYPVENVTYTKRMVSEIFAQQPISEAQYNFFASKGYDVKDKIITKAQAAMMSKEIEERKK